MSHAARPDLDPKQAGIESGVPAARVARRRNGRMIIVSRGGVRVSRALRRRAVGGGIMAPTSYGWCTGGWGGEGGGWRVHTGVWGVGLCRPVSWRGAYSHGGGGSLEPERQKKSFSPRVSTAPHPFPALRLSPTTSTTRPALPCRLSHSLVHARGSATPPRSTLCRHATPEHAIGRGCTRAWRLEA